MSRASLLPVHCPTIPSPQKIYHFRIPLNLSCPCSFSFPVSLWNAYHLVLSLEFNYHYKWHSISPLDLSFFAVTIYDSMVRYPLQYPFYLHSWTMVSLKLFLNEWKSQWWQWNQIPFFITPSPSTPILYRNLCWRMVHNCSWCRSLPFFLCCVLSSSCDTHYNNNNKSIRSRVSCRSKNSRDGHPSFRGVSRHCVGTLNSMWIMGLRMVMIMEWLRNGKIEWVVRVKVTVWPRYSIFFDEELFEHLGLIKGLRNHFLIKGLYQKSHNHNLNTAGSNYN